jgi:hypothetical protein
MQPEAISRTRSCPAERSLTAGWQLRELQAVLDASPGATPVTWDNLNSPISSAMAGLIAARNWLTVYRLPPYAHELSSTTKLYAITPKNFTPRPRCLLGCTARAGANPGWPGGGVNAGRSGDEGLSRVRQPDIFVISLYLSAASSAFGGR